MKTIGAEEFRERIIETLYRRAPGEYLARQPLSRLVLGAQANGLDLPAPTTKDCRGCGETKPISDFPDLDSCECFDCGIDAPNFGNSTARKAYQRRAYKRAWMRQNCADLTLF